MGLVNYISPRPAIRLGTRSKNNTEMPLLEKLPILSWVTMRSAWARAVKIQHAALFDMMILSFDIVWLFFRRSFLLEEFSSCDPDTRRRDRNPLWGVIPFAGTADARIQRVTKFLPPP